MTKLDSLVEIPAWLGSDIVLVRSLNGVDSREADPVATKLFFIFGYA
jgi:hypothetical protein